MPCYLAWTTCRTALVAVVGSGSENGVGILIGQARVGQDRLGRLDKEDGTPHGKLITFTSYLELFAFYRSFLLGRVPLFSFLLARSKHWLGCVLLCLLYLYMD